MKQQPMKGEFGYLSARKRAVTVRTGVLLGVTVLIFLTGLVLTKGNQNIFSILAAVMCIPVGISAVNMVMYYRARPCSATVHDAIEAVRGGLFIIYDLSMTSYDRTYHIAAATVLGQEISCFTEDDTLDVVECRNHVNEILLQNGYENTTIQVEHSLDSFVGRLKELETERSSKGLTPCEDEADHVPGTRQTIAGILMSISL